VSWGDPDPKERRSASGFVRCWLGTDSDLFGPDRRYVFWSFKIADSEAGRFLRRYIFPQFFGIAGFFWILKRRRNKFFTAGALLIAPVSYILMTRAFWWLAQSYGRNRDILLKLSDYLKLAPLALAHLAVGIAIFFSLRYLWKQE